MAECKDCGDALTPEEAHYYEFRCEECEGRWHERITRWRKGGNDPALDKLFGELTGRSRVIN